MERVVWQIGLLFLLLLCIGCSSSQVHVFDSGLNKAQWTKLLKRLDREGINYKLNTLSSVTEYSHPTLVYFPGDLNAELLQQLTTTVQSLGFERLDVRVFNRHTHFYTKGNLGLYFPVQNKHDALPDLLYSVDCKHPDIRITLMKNGRWRATNHDVAHFTEGHWQYDPPYLTLIHAGKYGQMQQAFKAKQHQVMTLQGPKNATTYQVLGHKSYSLALFNCNLQIIYAEHLD